MSQNNKAMKILDGIFIGFTMVLVMAVAGLPLEWLLDLVSKTSLAIEGISLAVVSAALGLIYAIAGSEQAPSGAIPADDARNPVRSGTAGGSLRTAVERRTRGKIQ